MVSPQASFLRDTGRPLDTTDIGVTGLTSTKFEFGEPEINLSDFLVNYFTITNVSGTPCSGVGGIQSLPSRAAYISI